MDTEDGVDYTESSASAKKHKRVIINVKWLHSNSSSVQNLEVRTCSTQSYHQSQQGTCDSYSRKMMHTRTHSCKNWRASKQQPLRNTGPHTRLLRRLEVAFPMTRQTEESDAASRVYSRVCGLQHPGRGTLHVSRAQTKEVAGRQAWGGGTAKKVEGSPICGLGDAGPDPHQQLHWWPPAGRDHGWVRDP